MRYDLYFDRLMGTGTDVRNDRCPESQWRQKRRVTPYFEESAIEIR